MYDKSVRALALALSTEGATISQISRQTHVARSTIRDWLARAGDDASKRTLSIHCFVCNEGSCTCPTEYGYLLGQYLGDGYIASSTRVPRLRITCADSYPGIAAEVDHALHMVSGNRTSSVQAIGCSDHGAYWRHWTCVFPQHGPGPKHRRRIELADWQRTMITARPWPFLRGMIHSDGCRSLNTVTVRGRRYSYPRYFFANESRDILRIMGWALDLVGAQWRYNRPNSISIARRASVALLDEHIGPKT